MKASTKSLAWSSVCWTGGDFMKSPPVQYTDDQARDMVEAFIAEDKPKKKSKGATLT